MIVWVCVYFEDVDRILCIELIICVVKIKMSGRCERR